MLCATLCMWAWSHVCRVPAFSLCILMFWVFFFLYQWRKAATRWCVERTKHIFQTGVEHIKMYLRKIYHIIGPLRLLTQRGFKWWEKCHQWRGLLWAFSFSKDSSQICSNVSPRWLSLSLFIFLVNSFEGFNGLVGCDGGVSVSWEGCHPQTDSSENVTSRGHSLSVMCLLLFLQVSMNAKVWSGRMSGIQMVPN